MNSINEKAYAKINISLDVTGKRPDGYHDMLMVMQTITLCDDVTVTLTPGKVSRAESNLRFVPCARQMCSLPRQGSRTWVCT